MEWVRKWLAAWIRTDREDRTKDPEAQEPQVAQAGPVDPVDLEVPEVLVSDRAQVAMDLDLEALAVPVSEGPDPVGREALRKDRVDQEATVRVALEAPAVPATAARDRVAQGGTVAVPVPVVPAPADPALVDPARCNPTAAAAREVQAALAEGCSPALAASPR